MPMYLEYQYAREDVVEDKTRPVPEWVQAPVPFENATLDIIPTIVRKKIIEGRADVYSFYCTAGRGRTCSHDMAASLFRDHGIITELLAFQGSKITVWRFFCDLDVFAKYRPVYYSAPTCTPYMANDDTVVLFGWIPGIDVETPAFLDLLQRCNAFGRPIHLRVTTEQVQALVEKHDLLVRVIDADADEPKSCIEPVLAGTD